MRSYKDVKDEMLRDPEFKAFSDENKIFSDIAKALVAGRMAKGLTQKELAARIGMHQADISRYEKLDQVPTIQTLKRLAEALDLTLRIELIPNVPEAPAE